MSKFQDRVAKKRTSKSHKRLLDTPGGNPNVAKHGTPFVNKRPVDKSNAFFAKEEHSHDPEEDLEESSVVSGGDIEGHAGGAFGSFEEKNKKHKKDLEKRKKNEVIEMQSRQEIVQELRVRSTIKRMLKVQKIKMIKEMLDRLESSLRIRKVLSKLISESDVEKNPHANTGINKLEELLKKIVPTLEDSYKTLTSNKQQRSSFRSHILNAIENAIKPEDANSDVDSDEIPQDLEEVEINIKDSDPLGASDEDKFIDISDAEGGDKEEEEDPLDSFGIEGEDTTGRNSAFEAFKQVENQIVDAYGVLQDPNDRKVFYDYLLTNVKMYFDKFEEELSAVVSEPESDSYDLDPSDDMPSPEEEI